MRRVARPVALVTLAALAALACNVLSPGPATPTLSAVPPSATLPATATVPPTVAPSATVPPTEPPTQAASATSAPSASDTPAPEATTQSAPSDTPGAAGNQSFLAYVMQGQLLVTDVTGGAVGGTTQYTQAGVNDGVYDLVWSPSGQLIAFVSAGTGRDAHVYVVYAVGAGTPVDLGPGGQPNWSPDSTRIAFVRDGNIWITPVDNPQPVALTNQQNWSWGRPTFTPAGDSLVVSGQSFDNMGAQGNTEFDLATLPLDGSGTLTPLPGMTQKIEGRLPYDLRFSPDGTKLAFSTSWHISACASAGAYYVAGADGSGMTQVNSRQLSALLQPNQDFYYLVLGYAWKPQSDGLLITSLVIDCTNFAGTHLGEAMSTVTLTGDEAVLGVGLFASPSYDHSGSLIAVSQPDQSGGAGQVALVDAGGQPVATVGPGDLPAFQP
jgi:dipeptidyl aminopeptidase/acylaminoacyl peptidase